MDEVLLTQLSAYADGELNASEARHVEEALQRDPSLRKILFDFQVLDRQAALLPEPKLEAEAEAALGALLRDRMANPERQASLDTKLMKRMTAALAPVPEIGADRWARMWTNLRPLTTERTERAGRAVTSSTPRALPLEADFTPVGLRVVSSSESQKSSGITRPSFSIWRAAVLMTAAAVLMLGVGVAFYAPPPSPGTSMHNQVAAKQNFFAAEALDQHYFTMVKHVPGVETPVDCYFLKDEEPEPSPPQFDSKK